MAVLGEEDVEVWPSTFTALVHVVAGHEELWREHGGLLTVLELQSGLHDLGEGDGVARSTVALVSEVAGIVIAVDVSEVVGFWKFFVGDVLSVLVLLHEVLSFGLGCLEGFVAWDSEFLLVGSGLVLVDLGIVLIGVRNLSKSQRLVAVISIFGVRLSVFAHIGFPSQIEVVYCGNKQICLIRGFVLQVKIRSLLGSFVGLFAGFHANVSLNLWSFSSNNLGSNLVMLDDFIILDFSSVICLSLLNIVVFFSGTMEALNLMLRHGKTFSSDMWDVQSETDHGLITLRVKFLVVSRLNVSEF